MSVSRPPWMSVRQVAKRLGLARSTVQKYVELGYLQRVRITPQSWGVSIESVAQYEAQLAQENARESSYKPDWSLRRRMQRAGGRRSHGLAACAR